MQLKSKLLVLAMGLATGTAAQASYPPVLTWTEGISGGRDSSPSNMSMNFTISQPHLTHVATLVDNAFLSSFSYLALGVFKSGGPMMGSVIGPGSFSFTPAGAGTYTAVVFGDPGTYLGYQFSTFGVTVTPVPEPETWAMVLTGLGLVGLQLRRKIKTPTRIALN